jgi:hypothetical protein
MDASQLAGGNIPPEALQALQQQQGSGMDITAILAQLAQMSPDEVSVALQQLGINVPPQQLAAAAEQWVENAASKQASGGAPDEAATAAEDEGDSASTPATPTSSAPTDDEAAEAVPDDEEMEGEGPPSSAAANMPRGGSSRGGNMDALISAAMSQGDPQSMPRPTRGAMPSAPPRVASPQATPAAGNDPRMRAMLQSIYRSTPSSPQQRRR